MTHFTDDPNSVRVDFFKPSGKWKYCVSVWWDSELYDGDTSLAYAFERVLKRSGAWDRFAGLTAVCLHPYHEHAHPLMRRLPRE